MYSVKGDGLLYKHSTLKDVIRCLQNCIAKQPTGTLSEKWFYTNTVPPLAFEEGKKSIRGSLHMSFRLHDFRLYVL